MRTFVFCRAPEGLPGRGRVSRPVVLFTFLALTLALGSRLPAQEEPAPGQSTEAAPPAPEKKEEKAAEPEKKPDQYLALLHGDVYTVSGPVIRSADVLVKNGIIFRIGRDLDLPEGCETLEVKGMRVYPGLVAAGSRGILGREPPEETTDLFDVQIVLGLAGGLTTVVTGNTAAKLTYGTTEGMVLKRPLFQRLRYGYESPNTRRELREDLAKTSRYLGELQAFETEKALGNEKAAEPDKSWIKGKYENYLKLLKGEETALVSASTSREIEDVCELAETFGFRLVIEGGEEAWAVPSALGRAGASLLFTPRKKRSPDSRTNRPTGSKIETAALLHEQGVRFAVLPEGQNISLDGITGRDLLILPMEAAFAVRGGLPEDAAIRAITLDAARILGLDRRIGSIEVGKEADLIVCDGDLLHYDTWVQWTIVNGRVVYDKEKETLFSHIRPRRPSEEGKGFFWPRPFEAIETAQPPAE